jgi:hypothetical protein
LVFKRDSPLAKIQQIIAWREPKCEYFILLQFLLLQLADVKLTSILATKVGGREFISVVAL